METIRTEVAVGAPAAIAWDVISDLDGWARWNPVMRGKGNFELGARPLITIAPPGAKPIEFRPLVVEFDEGEALSWRRRLFIPGVFDSQFTLRVHKNGSAGSRFEQVGEFSGLLAGTLFSRNAKAFNLAFQTMGRSLKREAERLAAERP